MRIKNCRICKNDKLIEIGSLGKIAISDFTDTPTMGKGFPIDLVYCKKCTLFQMAYNIPRHLLYKDYWYESHINSVIVKDLKEIAKFVQPGGVHIDIAANDGTLLKFSKANNKIAVDPSNIKPQGVTTWIRDYWENVTLLGVADTITAIACLYDLPNPNKFIKNVTRHLAPNGIFIAQLQTLSPMIELNDVGNLCHEHLEFYSYKSLVTLYEQNGLEIFRIEKNGMNGGSYRIFARHYKTGSIKFKEKSYGVRELKDFFKRVEDNKNKMIKFLEKGYNVAGFGASTKANTILQYYGLGDFDVVDVNPRKKGKWMIGSYSKVVDKIPKGTEYLWVFPYGFMEYFKKKEKRYRGKWVTTIPKFKII